MGLPLDLQFRTKGQLAIDICTDAYADGVALRLRLRGRGLRQLHRSCGSSSKQHEQAYVLRVASTFMLTLRRGDPADLRAGGRRCC